MNEIITRLNEIEEKADAMILDAKDRKKQMETQLELDKKAIDEKYAALEKEKMEKLKQRLQAEAERQSEQETRETKQAVTSLNERFEREQEAMAEEVFQRVIAE